MTALAEQQLLDPDTEELEERKRLRDENSRMKILVMSRDVLLLLFQAGANGVFARCKGMPKDARLDGISEHYKFQNNQITLRIWSSEFPIVPEGCCCLELELEFDQFDVKGHTEEIARLAMSADINHSDVNVHKIRDMCHGMLAKIDDTEPKLEKTWGYGNPELEEESLKVLAANICANCGYDHNEAGCSDYKPVAGITQETIDGYNKASDQPTGYKYEKML